MHNEILSSDQTILLPLIDSFSSSFCLIGGTAIAVYIGHRRSIDFDLLTTEPLDANSIRNSIGTSYKINSVFVDETHEYTIVVDGIKCTFVRFPYHIEAREIWDTHIQLPDLLTLGAMKAFALGRRAKWKDYVDLYFIFQQYSLFDLVLKAENIFKTEFNEKLFREQLAYHKDIDYTEAVDFMPSFVKPDDEIKAFLIDVSLQR